MSQSFDTAATVRELEAAGLDRPQAEAITSALRNARLDDLQHLATKAHLAELEARMQATLWRALLIQAFAIVGAVVAAIKLIP